MKGQLGHRLTQLHRSALMATIALGLAGLATLFCGSVSSAYDPWSLTRTTGNCADCHGNDRGTAPYASASDGALWKDPVTSASLNLHDRHRR